MSARIGRMSEFIYPRGALQLIDIALYGSAGVIYKVLTGRFFAHNSLFFEELCSVIL